MSEAASLNAQAQTQESQALGAGVTCLPLAQIHVARLLRAELQRIGGCSNPVSPRFNWCSLRSGRGEGEEFRAGGIAESPCQGPAQTRRVRMCGPGAWHSSGAWTFEVEVPHACATTKTART